MKEYLKDLEEIKKTQEKQKSMFFNEIYRYSKDKKLRKRLLTTLTICFSN